MGGGKGPGRDMGHSPEREREGGPKTFFGGSDPQNRIQKKGRLGRKVRGKRKKGFLSAEP